MQVISHYFTKLLLLCVFAKSNLWKKQQVINQDTRCLKMKVDDEEHPVHFDDDEGDEYYCTGSWAHFPVGREC